MIERDPQLLYPNSVANAIVDRLRSFSFDFDVYHFAKELFTQEEGLAIHPRAYETTGCFVHALGPEPIEQIRPGLVEHDVRSRVRVSHHNPRSEKEQHAEAQVYAQRAMAAIQGYKIPIEGVHGVSGGVRYCRITSPLEETLNVPDFAVYTFDVRTQLQHDYRDDLP